MSKSEVVQRVVGSAVHPKAVERLLELWPDAYVEVHHSSPDARWDGLPARWSRVEFWDHQPAGDKSDLPIVIGIAHCHPLDQFERKRGIALAFNRALKQVTKVPR